MFSKNKVTDTSASNRQLQPTQKTAEIKK